MLLELNDVCIRVWSIGGANDGLGVSNHVVFSWTEFISKSKYVSCWLGPEVVIPQNHTGTKW